MMKLSLIFVVYCSLLASGQFPPTRVYISPDSKTDPLSPAYDAKPFRVDASDLVVRREHGKEIDSAELEEIHGVSMPEFTSINQVFFAYKEILLIGCRELRKSAEIQHSIGEYFALEGGYTCVGTNSSTRRGDWPLWNANKDNVIYQTVKSVVQNNPESLEALMTDHPSSGETIFGLVQNEGPNPHWGIGRKHVANETFVSRHLRWNAANTYGHILASLRKSFEAGDDVGAFRVFYVGPKTGDEDMQLWDVGQELATK